MRFGILAAVSLFAVTVCGAAAATAGDGSSLEKYDGAGVTSEAQATAGRPTLQEIVVTAQKREERLGEVPVPVSVVDTRALTENHELRLQDYYSSVPGLTVAPNLQSTQTLSIRGITTGPYANPTVGVMVDDVPYGSGDQVPDIDPADLARIEVLRGPQGTLYGASSMGGLLKFVTLDPSTQGVSGRVEAGTQRVYNGGNLGYSVRGSVNVPLSDALAIRGSAFTRLDPGYIDNPVLHIQDLNEARISGGRLAGLWRPSDQLSVKLSALYQQSRGDGSDDVNQAVNGYSGPPLGDLQQNYVRGVGGYDRRVQAYSANVHATLGRLDLVAVSGYNVNSFSDSLDFTSILGACCTLPQFGVLGTPVFNSSSTHKFAQELRLSSAIGHFDWLVGGFYTHERTPSSQHILATDPTTGALAGDWLYVSFPNTYAEIAAFADLTYHFTDRFDVQVGGRWSHIRQVYDSTYIGIYDQFFLGAPSPIVTPQQHSSASPFTYLFTPRLRLSPDAMVYLRLASGYRAGGVNQAGPGIPPQYDPDKTRNYELGLKADLLDRRLSIDTSVYYIDWRDIQLPLVVPATSQGYTGNASGAKSEGVEFAVTARPAAGLTVSGWVTWTEAVLTQPFPPGGPGQAYGVPGDRLPYSPRWAGNLALRQQWGWFSGWTGYAAVTQSYVGSRFDNFTIPPPMPPPRQVLPAYAKLDLTFGLMRDSWDGALFVTNATNRRGMLDGGAGNFIPYAYQYIRPRTIGLTLSRTF